MLSWVFGVIGREPRQVESGETWLVIPCLQEETIEAVKYIVAFANGHAERKFQNAGNATISLIVRVFLKIIWPKYKGGEATPKTSQSIPTTGWNQKWRGGMLEPPPTKLRG